MLEETLPHYSLYSLLSDLYWNSLFLLEMGWMCGIVPTNVCNRTVFSVLSPTGPNGYCELDPVSSAIRRPERRGPASSLPGVPGVLCPIQLCSPLPTPSCADWSAHA